MTEVIINGFRSSSLAGCQLLDMGEVRGASPRRSEVTVYGANGQLSLSEGAFDGYEETFSFVVQRLGDIETLVSQFRLMDNELEFGYQLGSLRYADYLGVSYQPLGLHYWQVDVRLYLHPFRYQKGGSDTVLTGRGTVVNPGTVFSEPVIIIEGRGRVTLTIGSQLMELELDGQATIDCRHKKQAIYDKNGRLKNTIRLRGAFFELPVGSSGVSTTGTVTKLTIKGNWRYLV